MSGYGVVVGSDRFNLNVQSENEDESDPNGSPINKFSQSLSNSILLNKKQGSSN